MISILQHQETLWGKSRGGTILTKMVSFSVCKMTPYWRMTAEKGKESEPPHLVIPRPNFCLFLLSWASVSFLFYEFYAYIPNRQHNQIVLWSNYCNASPSCLPCPSSSSSWLYRSDSCQIAFQFAMQAPSSTRLWNTACWQTYRLPVSAAPTSGPDKPALQTSNCFLTLITVASPEINPITLVEC